MTGGGGATAGAPPTTLDAGKTLRLSPGGRFLYRQAESALKYQAQPLMRLHPGPFVRLVYEFVQTFRSLAEEMEEVQEMRKYWTWALDTPLTEVEAVEYAAAAVPHVTRSAAVAVQPEPVRVPVQGWRDGDTSAQLQLHLFALQAVIDLLMARALAEVTISDGLASLSAVTPVAGTRPGP
jgi:hypothetical protein